MFICTERTKAPHSMQHTLPDRMLSTLQAISELIITQWHYYYYYYYYYYYSFTQRTVYFTLRYRGILALITPAVNAGTDM